MDIVRRLLFLRTDSIGDNVLAAAMLPPLREHFADSEIVVLCQAHIAELYESSPHVDRVLTYVDGRLRSDAEYRHAKLCELNDEAFDLLLNTVYSRDPINDLLALGSGAAETVAFRGDLCNISAELRDADNLDYTRLLESDEAWMTELDRHRDFLAGLGIEAPELEPLVWTTDEDEAFAAELLAAESIDPDAAIAVFPGAQSPWRVWPHYAEVLREFAEYPIIVFGAPSDAPMTAQICSDFQGRSVDLAGRTTLRQMAALMRRCRVYLGAESAGVHFASAVGLRNVVLVGGGHFGRFVPYSHLTTTVAMPLACYRCCWRCPYTPQAQCVSAISPAVVAEALRMTLDRTNPEALLVMQSDQSGLNGTQWRDDSDMLCRPSDTVLL